jgi:hypothetical protein
MKISAFLKAKGRAMLVIALVVVFFSCEEKLFTFNVDCNECYTDQPTHGDIIVSISQDLVNDSIGLPYIVYEGDLENNKVMFIDTIKANDTLDAGRFYVFMELDKPYTFKMKYLAKDNRIFYVIDGCRPVTKQVSDECSEPCWVITGNKISLTVKYQDYFDK